MAKPKNLMEPVDPAVVDLQLKHVDWFRSWAREQYRNGADTAVPDGRGEPSDWNLHGAEMDAGPAAQDEFAGHVAALTAAATFHLPGKHDQRTHGHRHVPDGHELELPGAPSGHGADFAAKWHRDLRGLNDLITSVESGTLDAVPLSDGVSATVVRAQMKNGTDVLQQRLKDVGDDPDLSAARQADSEQLTSTLGRAIGASVPRTLRTNEHTIAQDFVYGTDGSQLLTPKPKVKMGRPRKENPIDVGRRSYDSEIENVLKSSEAQKIGLLDLLTVNWSRQSPGNWLVDDEHGHVVGVGHGQNWMSLDTQHPERAPDEGTDPSPFLQSFVRGGQWIPNPLTKADVEFLQSKLADVQGDFHVLDRGDWWQVAQARLNVLAEHASGTKNLFAPLTASAEFHLPGQHDQKTHGHRFGTPDDGFDPGWFEDLKEVSGSVVHTRSWNPSSEQQWTSTNETVRDGVCKQLRAGEEPHGRFIGSDGEEHAADKVVDDMDLYTRSSKVGKNVELWRAIVLPSGTSGQRFPVGAVVTDKAFVSTSFTWASARAMGETRRNLMGGEGEVVLLRILLPKGSFAAPGDVSVEEAILPRNLPMKVVASDNGMVTLQAVKPRG